MLLATRSFLSALSFCFKISMLVSAAVGSAAVWAAKADPARSMAPVRKHAISLYMDTSLLLWVKLVMHDTRHAAVQTTSGIGATETEDRSRGDKDQEARGIEQSAEPHTDLSLWAQ